VIVAADRETFSRLDLTNVVPRATLDHLGATVSKSPFDLTPADSSHGVRAAGSDNAVQPVTRLAEPTRRLDPDDQRSIRVCRRPEAGPGLVCGTTPLLDQLGGIWEITTGVTLPKALPTGLKRGP
jgi:hypothetical protein